MLVLCGDCGTKHAKMSTKKNLLMLFERPKEPIFTPRGDNQVFNVPDNMLQTEYLAAFSLFGRIFGIRQDNFAKYSVFNNLAKPLFGASLSDRFKPLANTISNRFNDSKQIEISQVSTPNLGEITSLGKRDQFSLFIPKHNRLAGQLIKILMACKDLKTLESVSIFCRERCNPLLFNYALSVTILHRSDTTDMEIPSLVETFPDKFMDSQVIGKCTEELSITQENITPIEIPREYTASNAEDEQRLAYFREDIGVNLHHWHWHLVYPIDTERALVDKNRRGELFYYMHQQIISRYNFERFCNGLGRVRKWNNWMDPIPEAYFPKLDSLVASRAYPSRVKNQTVQNLNRVADSLNLDVDAMIRWRDRLYGAIHQGFINDERGRRIELTEFEGIDILGNMIEASILSPNANFYGNLHNMMHNIVAYIHDPDHRHLEAFSTIGDSSTAMRDPMFYPLHAFIDDMFQEFKSTLPRYSEAQLNFKDVTVRSIEVKSDKGRSNELNTFWQQSDIDLSRGMDFQPRGEVRVRFTHLQHQPFTYNITVMNNGPQRQGTVRIFMAPKVDERGNPWLLRDQRLMFIELDKFVVSLKQGENKIQRKSTESSLTITFESTFRNVDRNRPTGGDALETFNMCGCGWPQHMLIPKGLPQGLTSQLFVMVSNYEDDKVVQDTKDVCESGVIFCGLRNRLYPDRRSMGYPFDRVPRDRVDTLQQFLTPNMMVQDVTIRHTDQILQTRR